MTLIDSLFAQAIRAVREPREAAADVVALGVPREAFVPGLVVVLLLSVFLTCLAEAISPSVLSLWTPFQLAALVLALYGALAFAICKIGQMMEGLGNCADSVLLMAFLVGILLPFKALQVVLMTVSPALAGLVALFVFFLSLWLHVNFIAALHGYDGLGKAIGVFLLSFFVVGIFMAFFAPMIGINITAMVPNV